MPDFRRASALAGVLLALASMAVAAPPLTTIDDVLYKADGTRFEGIAYIEWKQFTASDLSYIAPNVTSVQILQGVLRLQLVPTATAPGGAYYLVKYYSSGQQTFSESWAVPPSLTPLRVSDVRISSSGALGGTSGGLSGGVSNPVLITDVTGLTTELAARPTKGPAFLTSRVAFINPTGSIEGVIGNLADCVRVDGTTGPCGSSAPYGPGFVDAETPAGAVNGSNTVYSLANVPSPPESLLLYRNGLLMKNGLDYSVSGITITFVAGATPQSGDILLASYRLAGSGTPAGGGMPAHTIPQVICSSTGTGTSGTAMVRLGSCTIPAGYLASGDRLEIQADYSHQGAGTGFAAEVRWGSTTILSRTAAAGDAAMAVRATSGIHSTGAAWTTQSWGSSLPAAAAVGQASDSAGSGILLDFLGRMVAASSETVKLQSFMVVRYPAQSNSE